MRNLNLKSFPKGYWCTPSIVLSSKLKAFVSNGKQISVHELPGYSWARRYPKRLLVEQLLKNAERTGLDIEKRIGDEFAVACWICVFPIRVTAHSTSIRVVGKESGLGLRQPFMNPRDYINRPNSKRYHHTAIAPRRVLVFKDENYSSVHPAAL